MLDVSKLSAVLRSIILTLVMKQSLVHPPHPHFYVKIISPVVTVRGGVTLGRCSARAGGARPDGSCISQGRFRPHSLPPDEETGRKCQGGTNPHQAPPSANTSILGFLTLRENFITAA